MNTLLPSGLNAGAALASGERAGSRGSGVAGGGGGLIASNDGTGGTATLPDGSASGDLVLFFVASSREILVNTPGGWWFYKGGFEGNSNQSGSMIARVLDGTAADTPPTITSPGGSISWSGVLIRGHGVVDIFDLAVNQTSVASGSTSVNPPRAIVPGGVERDVISLAFASFYAAPGTVTMPAGYEQVTVAGQKAVAYQASSAVSSVNPDAFSWTNGSNAVGMTVAVPMSAHPSPPDWKMRWSGVYYNGKPWFPSGIEAGDLLLAVGAKTNFAALTPPTGWTALGLNDRMGVVFYKVADGSETGYFSTLPSALGWTLGVVQGVAPVPYATVANGATTSDSNPITVPAVSPLSQPALALSWLWSGSAPEGAVDLSLTSPADDVLILDHLVGPRVQMTAATVASTAEIASEVINPSGWANWKGAARATFLLSAATPPV